MILKIYPTKYYYHNNKNKKIINNYLICFINKIIKYDNIINIHNLFHYYNRNPIISLKKIINIFHWILLIKIEKNIELIKIWKHDLLEKNIFWYRCIWWFEEIIQYINIMACAINTNNVFYIFPCFVRNHSEKNLLIGRIINDRMRLVHFLSNNIVPLSVNDEQFESNLKTIVVSMIVPYSIFFQHIWKHIDFVAFWRIINIFFLIQCIILFYIFTIFYNKSYWYMFS